MSIEDMHSAYSVDLYGCCTEGGITEYTHCTIARRASGAAPNPRERGAWAAWHMSNLLPLPDLRLDRSQSTPRPVVPLVIVCMEDEE